MQVFKPFRFFIFLFVSMLLSLPAIAAELAGHVIISKGTVQAIGEAGDSRTLKRRSEFYSGDTITTGDNSSVQLRFVDKALMTIKASSELSITDYLVDKTGSGTGEEKALMKLVKGGFRTITGSIGKGEKSAYRVDTPAASIGIRGTNYEVQQEGGESFVMAVYSGGIRVENDAGSLDLGLGADFNYVRVTPTSAPEGLLAPPATLSTGSVVEQEESEEESEDDSASSDDESDETEESTQDEEASGDETASTDSDTDDDSTAVPLVDDDSGSSTIATVDTSDTTNTGPQSELDTRIATEIANVDNDTRETITNLGGTTSEALTENIKDEIANNKDIQEVLAAVDGIDSIEDLFGQEESDIDDLFAELQNEGSGQSGDDGGSDDSGTDTGTDSGTDDGTDSGTDSGPTVNVLNLAAPFEGLTIIPTQDPRLTNAEYSLLDSGRIAAVAVPVGGTGDHEAALFSPVGITGFDNGEVYNFGTARVIGANVTDGFNFDNANTPDSHLTFDFGGSDIFTIPLAGLGNATNADQVVQLINDLMAQDPALFNKVFANHDNGILYFEARNEFSGGFLNITEVGPDLFGLGLNTGNINGFNPLTMTLEWVTEENPTIQSVTIQINETITSLDDLIESVNNQLSSNSVPLMMSKDPFSPDETRLTIHALDQDTVFVREIGLANIDYGSIGGENNFVSLLGSMNEGMYFSVEEHVEVFIGKGTVDANGRPIFHDEFEDDDGQGGTIAMTEVIRRGEPNQVVDGFLSALQCGKDNLICDVAVFDVDGRQNVAWGLWAADADNPIQIFDDPNNPDAFREEHDIAVYWIAAEPADINTLTGTATFSSTLSCTDYSQCIGSANNGYVHSMSGQFNVNFDTGAVNNGTLTVNVADDFNPQLTTQVTATRWDVQFNGQVNGVGLHAGVDTANSHISGSTQCQGCVFGEVGGVFVKPGDAFAGGYNLQQTGNKDVHAEGVFILQKQP